VRPTWHLVPHAVWEALAPGQLLEPASLAAEGFVHCTDGDDELIATANRHYATDPQPFLAVSIDLDRVGSPWRIDVAGSPYPHVYGPIPVAAIVDVVPLRRDAAGRFIALEKLSPESA
jgi:uncharacterized protein (DUF952 family)